MTNEEKKYPIFLSWAVFVALLIWQHQFRAEAWPYSLFHALPEPLGSVVTAIFWIGAGPLAVAFLFLIPVYPKFLAFRVAVYMSIIISIFAPLSNYIFNMFSVGVLLDFKTIALNVMSLIGVSILIYLILLLLPSCIIFLISKKV